MLTTSRLNGGKFENDKMSQISQLSQASTIPYGFSQDITFIEEITEVDKLYFNEKCVENNSHNSYYECHTDIFASVSESDSESDNDITVHNDESDTDSDHSENIQQPNYVQFELSAEDAQENVAVQIFFLKSCGCSQLYGQSCSSVVDRDSIVSLREYCASLERDELDLVIKSSLYSQRKNGPQTDSVKHVRKERHRPSQNFFLKGREVCREVFCFAHGIGNKKFRNICQSLDLHGLVPRTHGNTHKRPHNALLFSDRDTIKQFILRYASENAVPLPGRLPNYRESKVLLLPSDKTKADIHDIFTLAG